MASLSHLSPSTSEEIFREVDHYDPSMDIASGSGQCPEVERVSSRPSPGGDGTNLNQLGFHHPEEPFRASDPWFDLYPSWLTEEDEPRIRAFSGAPSDYTFIFPLSEDRAHAPPPGYYTFYLDQLEGGLRFPLPLFFQQLSQFYQIHLGQFTPNAFRTLCNFVVLFKALGYEVDPLTFSHFYLPKRSEEGPFYFSARPNCQFFEGAPSSNKNWKHNFFFVQPSESWDICSRWRAALPELPTPPPGFRKSSTFLEPFGAIRGRRFHTPTLLAEDLLSYYGLSSAKVSPKGNEGMEFSSVPALAILPLIISSYIYICFFVFLFSFFLLTLLFYVSANRVMNALIQKVAARKPHKGSSAGAGKGKAAASEVIRDEVPVVTIADVPEPPPSSSRKRRAPETPRPHGQSPSSVELGFVQPEAVPIRQVRPDSASRVLRCRSSLYDMYREDLRIIGAGPTPLGGAVLRDVVSTADAEFLQSLSWSDLLMRSHSATAEVRSS